MEVTSTRRVGVIGTVGTVASGAYQREVAAVGGEVELVCAACPGFVEFVERGETGGDQIHVLAERLLAPLRDAKIDSLLLGCTHYPFLARTLNDVMGRDVVLVSSADETAFEVRRTLESFAMFATPKTQHARPPHRWISTGDAARFESLGRMLLGPELGPVESWRW